MSQVKRVLIFRQGSLGDTVVALPCFRLIKQAYPGAKIDVLTNKPINSKACALEMVLENMGLVDEYFTYPASVKLSEKMSWLKKYIKEVRPDRLIYMLERPGLQQTWRDYLFFKFCGVKRIVGMTLCGKKQEYLFDDKTKRFEYEGRRLARQLEGLGKVDWSDPAIMNLSITDVEQQKIQPLILNWMEKQPFFVCSIGTKLTIKDWGQDNWKMLMSELSKLYPSFGLIFIGVDGESERSQELLDLWDGPTLNLCGKFSVRQSAAFLSRAKYFIGHDSGPMHLAAAAGASCVAIFSRHNKPACWFPFGDKHQVIYPKGDSVLSITVPEVIEAVATVVSSSAKKGGDV